ncbi:MAG: hypothetical protein U0165_07860 [Polyangiaceae bacterium]
MSTIRAVLPCASRCSATDDLPRLKLLLWNRSHAELSEEEAFSLYEQNRAWVRPDEMSAYERQFFDALVTRYGGGVFLG